MTQRLPFPSTSLNKRGILLNGLPSAEATWSGALFKARATYWHFMKTSCSSSGPWVMRWHLLKSEPPLRVHTSTDMWNRRLHITWKNCKAGNNVISLVILYSSGIASKCGFQLCGKRICVGRGVFAHLSYSFVFVFFEWEQLAQWRDYHNIALSETLRNRETIFVFTWHRYRLPSWKKGWTQNRLNIDRFAVFKASVPVVSKVSWGTVLAGEDTQRLSLVQCTVTQFCLPTTDM